VGILKSRLRLMKYKIIFGAVILVVIGVCGLWRLVEVQRNRAIRAVQDEIVKFERATEDHEYDAKTR
jgi:hypothetical protein